MPSTKPYTDVELLRSKCHACALEGRVAPAAHQWRFKACAVPELGYKYYPVCRAHSVAMNEVGVRILFGGIYDENLRGYREKVLAEPES